MDSASVVSFDPSITFTLDAACVSVDTPKLNPTAIANTQHMDIHRFIYLPPIFVYLGFPI